MAEWTPQRSPRSKAAVAVAILIAATSIVKPFEGRVKKTYPDVVYGWRLPTACDGHTGLTPAGLPLAAGQTFTDAECDEMRNADLTKTYDAMAPCFGDAKLSTNEWGAYLALGFNVGSSAVCGSSIPRKVLAGQHAAACATIGEFVNAGWIRRPHTNGPTDPGLIRDCRVAGNNCGGIVRRRAAERALCETR